MASKDDLLAIAPPLADGRSAVVNWTEFEDSVGVRLPEDYKWLIDTYGPGTFGNFLYVLQPYSEYEYVRLAHWMGRGREVLRQLGQQEALPYAPDELIPAAITDNGDTIYWIARPFDTPDSWTITGNEARNIRWPVFDGGIVGFLAEVLSGRYEFEIFPRGFPSAGPQFSRYSPRRRRER